MLRDISDMSIEFCVCPACGAERYAPCTNKQGYVMPFSHLERLETFNRDHPEVEKSIQAKAFFGERD